jgi:hypothetical protein
MTGKADRIRRVEGEKTFNRGDTKNTEFREERFWPRSAARQNLFS